MGRWVVTSQRADGLWTCYAHRPETGPETSGTAGIAAALLLAHELGLAPASVQDVARRALQGLERYLSPDGFLHGVTQSNKGGEELQRSGYRVYLQMGLGLAVQLAAIHRSLGGR
ncbi:MAG: glycoside hydrolase family 88 protein [Gemmatimonadaceae bacterium]|nr:glycoside hydrolase family 88 protein [Gemmatimonadaceae bacterium]